MPFSPLSRFYVARRAGGGGALLMLLSGPPIVFLFPVWLTGVWLRRRRIMLPARWAGPAFSLSIAIWLVYFWFDIGIKWREWMMPLAPQFIGGLHGSNVFAGDYLLTIIVALNFAAVAGMRTRPGFLVWLGPVSRLASSYTFSIYLFHAPIFALVLAGLGSRSWVSVPITLTLIGIVGYATEHRLRDVLRRALRRV